MNKNEENNALTAEGVKLCQTIIYEGTFCIFETIKVKETLQ
jgi:hypothetical protein